MERAVTQRAVAAGSIAWSNQRRFTALVAAGPSASMRAAAASASSAAVDLALADQVGLSGCVEPSSFLSERVTTPQ